MTLFELLLTFFVLLTALAIAVQFSPPLYATKPRVMSIRAGSSLRRRRPRRARRARPPYRQPHPHNCPRHRVTRIPRSRAVHRDDLAGIGGWAGRFFVCSRFGFSVAAHEKCVRLASLYNIQGKPVVGNKVIPTLSLAVIMSDAIALHCSEDRLSS